jgi:hypothetical protein
VITALTFESDDCTSYLVDTQERNDYMLTCSIRRTRSATCSYLRGIPLHSSG